MKLFRGRQLVALLVLCISSFLPSKLHAGTGIGVEGGAAVPLVNGNRLPYMLALTFKTDKLPFIITARAQLNGTQFSAGGLNADMWLDDIQIGYSIFNFYYGPGFTVLYHPEVESDDEDDFSQATGVFVAPRFFAGISTMLASFSEFYLQAAIEPGVVFDEAEGFIFRMNLPLSVGLRFWF